MKSVKRILAFVLAVVMVMSMAACAANDNASTAPSSTGATQPSTAPTETTPSEPAPTEPLNQAALDQAAADNVAALIDAIYVQYRDENTDRLCAEAKAAWDALTDAQKELVEGEEADPDYFGRDTGDASLDDPRNGDNIGKNELLVVSFGTSFNDSRVKDIKGIEDALQKANPDWSVRRAFTAQIIINHIQARDGEKIDNMQQALDRAVANGVENLVVQPTHLMHGAEYDEMVEAIAEYADKIPNISIAEPLLGPVGNSANIINADKQATADALVAASVKEAGFKTMEEAAKAGVAFVFMGHGTAHNAKVTYTQMQTQMEKLGYTNAFIGTVEGEPESTSCEAVIEAVKEAGFKTVILRPLMVVAGDHANNDMAGEDEDSWKSMFEASKAFEKVEAQIAGLGGIEGVQAIYVAHTAEAIANPGSFDPEDTKIVVGELEDGVYTVKFNTDSSMFHVSDAHNGKAILVVSNGKMTAHIVLSSKSYISLFAGVVADAEKDGAKVLLPTVEAVPFADGTVDEVNAYDIPIPVIGEEFDLATLGSKGKWYDHKVSVTAPVKVEVNQCDVVLGGGSGRATIESPAKVFKDLSGSYRAFIVWSSKSYEAMKVGEVEYGLLPTDGNSTFVIPVELDKDMAVSGYTVAMSNPHWIDYTLHFDSNSIK